MNIRVAHVKPRLHFGNMRMPEEVNKILPGQISAWLFCPTKATALNLTRERIDGRRIISAGEVMFDVVRYYRKRLGAVATCAGHRWQLSGKALFSTVHRAGTTDSPEQLPEMLEPSREISRQVRMLLSLHPRARKVFRETVLSPEAIRPSEPLIYVGMLYLPQHCKLALIDRERLQKRKLLSAESRA